MKAHIAKQKVKLQKTTKIILAIIISVLVLLIASSQVWRYREIKRIEQAQQEAAYADRLWVLDAREDVSFLWNGKYYIEVRVGDNTYYYSATIAYINWRQYCRATGDDSIGYDEFVQAMLNPEETAESWAIMKWVNVMSGTVNTGKVRDAFIEYLNTEEFLEKYPEQDWPNKIDACTLEQLEILYDYYLKQRGW